MSHQELQCRLLTFGFPLSSDRRHHLSFSTFITSRTTCSESKQNCHSFTVNGEAMRAAILTELLLIHLSNNKPLESTFVSNKESKNLAKLK